MAPKGRTEMDVGADGVAVITICNPPVNSLSVDEFTDSGSDNRDATLSECAQKDIAVKPQKGDALLFFNLSPDDTADSLSLRAGCPVIKGERWSAIKWIRVASFDKVNHAQGNCTDDNENCAKCTALGECTKNPEYMVGAAALPGYCRRTCNVC